MSINKFIIVRPFLGSGKERKRKFFGLSNLGNPVIKEGGRFVQTPIDGTDYDPKVHGDYKWEEPQEEWEANSLYCS